MFISRYQETDRCPYGDLCTFAHSTEELEEWKKRFAFRKEQLQQARDKFLHGNTFVEQLIEKLAHPDGPKAKVYTVILFLVNQIFAAFIREKKICLGTPESQSLHIWKL